jgi:colanic acid/amylovoran biosynthesis glycosyltransferase
VRLAVLVDRWPELSETFVAHEVEALAELGHDVRVEALDRARHPNPGAPAVPVAFAADESRAARRRALLGLPPARVGRDLAAARRWRREEAVRGVAALAPAATRLRRAGVEHLHAHFAATSGLHALRLGALLGVPYSVTAHAYDIYATPANLEEKLRRAAFATSGCAYSVDELRRRAGPEHAARMHEIVMGIRPDRLRRTTPYPGGRALLAVGRLVEKKGFGVLLDALDSLDDATLTIVGGGPLEGELRAAADPARVTFTGPLAPAAVRAELERADLLVVPSVIAADGDRDSMPVVAKEAMAMEIPVVASDLAGLPELVGPEAGRLVAPGDAVALASAIAELLALPGERRAAMGRAGRAHVERHADVRTEAVRLSELISSALS